MTITTYYYSGPGWSYTYNGGNPDDGGALSGSVTFDFDTTNATGWYGSPPDPMLGFSPTIAGYDIVDIELESGIYSGALSSSAVLQNSPLFYLDHGVITQWFIYFVSNGGEVFLTENWPVYTEDSLFIGYPIGTSGAGEIGQIGQWTGTGPTDGPIVASVEASQGAFKAGSTIFITLDMSDPVFVSGGTPTLELDDGDIATYLNGSGSSHLTFIYTVSSGAPDEPGVGNPNPLGIVEVDLNGATIQDAAGNSADLSGANVYLPGTQIDTSIPFVVFYSVSPVSGALRAGQTVTITLDMNENVTVIGPGGGPPFGNNVPTLSLNDAGIAAYRSGAGTDHLTFTYTVAAGENSPDLVVTGFNTNGCGIQDAGGNVADMSGLTSLDLGLVIDTTSPITAISDLTQATTKKTVTTTITGTSEADSVVSLYDGNSLLSTAIADTSGHWSISLSNLSNVVHNFVALGTDPAGNIGSLSQPYILGSTRSDKITAVAGGDVINGSGGNDALTAGTASDTFIFRPSFGKDTVSNFDLFNDVLAFDHALFASVSNILAHTKDYRGNAVITYDNADTVTLVGVKTADLLAHASDFHII